MSVEVSELVAAPRRTAVIAQATTWEAFPALWPVLLDEVWGAVRGNGLVGPGRNVMLYRDDVPNVEIGVEIAEAFAPVGRVVCSALPEGRVVMADYRGPFEGLGAGHEAVAEACAERGLRRLGPRWEIYGHWDEAAPDPRVEIYHLVGAAK